MRLSLDMLNTRNKEARLLQLCLDLQQRFVIDNTNPTPADRIGYIARAKSVGYRIIGYNFSCLPDDALRRNALREGKERIAEIGLRSTIKKLEPLRYPEGFDELYTVCLGTYGFTIAPLQHEV